MNKKTVEGIGNMPIQVIGRNQVEEIIPEKLGGEYGKAE